MTCTYGEMVAVSFLCVSKVYEELQKQRKTKCCILYLMIVGAVNVLLEFILYKDEYVHEILCIRGKK